MTSPSRLFFRMKEKPAKAYSSTRPKSGHWRVTSTRLVKLTSTVSCPPEAHLDVSSLNVPFSFQGARCDTAPIPGHLAETSAACLNACTAGSVRFGRRRETETSACSRTVPTKKQTPVRFCLSCRRYWCNDPSRPLGSSSAYQCAPDSRTRVSSLPAALLMRKPRSPFDSPFKAPRTSTQTDGRPTRFGRPRWSNATGTGNHRCGARMAHPASAMSSRSHVSNALDERVNPARRRSTTTSAYPSGSLLAINVFSTPRKTTERERPRAPKASTSLITIRMCAAATFTSNGSASPA